MQWAAWGVETPQGDHQQAYVLLTAQASAAEGRAPVMVNLVLDRSGSMKGAPLSAAVEAAQQLVELATPDDFIGLVLFDGVAEQRVPLSMMDFRGKRQLVDALAGLQTGRGTALHSAIELGLKGLKRTLIPGRKPRLLLLTDGEPSVGPELVAAFEELGTLLADQKVAVHALGLSKHYVPEVLQALTQPSGNAFEHVDGPDGLSEALGSLMAHLYGQVATDASVRVEPVGLAALTCCHSFPTSVDAQALTVMLGDVSRGYPRRVLLTGAINSKEWAVKVEGSARERDVVHRGPVELESVTPQSARGKLVVGVSHELQLLGDETAAWLSLARRDLERAEQQLESADEHARCLGALCPDGIPLNRHVERLADLRLAIERGEGDIPLLIRRAQSARAGVHVSQVIPLVGFRQRR